METQRVQMKGVLPWFVCCMDSSCSYNKFLSCVSCSSWPSTKYFFPHRTVFQFICPHHPASWAGSRAGSPVSNVYLWRNSLHEKSKRKVSCFSTSLQFSLIALNMWVCGCAEGRAWEITYLHDLITCSWSVFWRTFILKVSLIQCKPESRLKTSYWLL